MNPPRLEGVFVNLIQNAIQHSPSNSEVAIEVGMAPGSASQALQIVVRDHGPGILPEDLPRVFTPFFSRRVGGFGLGLAISQRIVDEHRGRVTATNGPAGGAVMTVIVPLSTRPEKAPAAGEVGPAC
jgi:signal transduction histidine kinase